MTRVLTMTGLLAVASLYGCAAPSPSAGRIYGQLGMTADADGQGRLRLIVGGVEAASADRIQIDGVAMRLTPCEWTTIKPMLAPAKDVAVIDALENGYAKGPQRQSREFSATLDRLVAARGLHPSTSEIACARRLLDDMAFSEDAN